MPWCKARHARLHNVVDRIGLFSGRLHTRRHRRSIARRLCGNRSPVDSRGLVIECWLWLHLPWQPFLHDGVLVDTRDRAVRTCSCEAWVDQGSANLNMLFARHMEVLEKRCTRMELITQSTRARVEMRESRLRKTNPCHGKTFLLPASWLGHSDFHCAGGACHFCRVIAPTLAG